MDLASYIRELILLNECIILPGFGGFETEYLPARYNSEKGEMLPPSKKVIFRSDFKIGGDILRNALVEKNKISEEKANEIIANYVADIKSSLSSGKNVVIKEVGTLLCSGDIQHIVFHPVSDKNFLAESFGLEALPVKRKIKQKSKPVIELPSISVRGRSNTISFIIVGIVVISILLTITILVASKYNLHLFNIGNNSVNDMLIIGGINISDSNVAKINNEINESTQIKNALLYEEKKQPEQKVISALERHYLIAGSFKTYKNAADLEKKILTEGFHPEIVEVDGFFRVCVGIFDNKTEALVELHKIRRQMTRSVWLLSVNGN